MLFKARDNAGARASVCKIERHKYKIDGIHPRGEGS